MKIKFSDLWRGKKVAFSGDPISGKNHLGTTKNDWDFYAETLGAPLKRCV